MSAQNVVADAMPLPMASLPSQNFNGSNLRNFALSISCLAVTAVSSMAAVQMPIEVNSTNDGSAIKSATVGLKNGMEPQRLWLKLHNLSYRTQASVRVNGGAWIDLRNDTPGLSMFDKARNHGGIGGANFTIVLTLNLPASGAGSAVQGGSNTVDFRFNGTDGNAMGFRVLDFDFVDASGLMCVSNGEKTEENPDNWTLPTGYTSASDISAGETLWRQRNLLKNSPLTPNQQIVASCSDCHAQDGLDLKYFSYSNRSIIDRSVFHGLTPAQGNRIAAYIRSLDYPNPGRPWNPPYQPGPGLDSKPIVEWAAGAGIDAVLNEDSDAISYMPNATNGDAWRTGNHIKPFPIHDVPLAIQLIDWNRWLPKIHPLDMTNPHDFLTDPMYTTYTKVRTNLDADRDGYVTGGSFRGDLGAIGGQIGSLSGSPFKLALNPNPNLPDEPQEVVDNVYSAAVWSAVKLFEIMHEYDLIKMPRVFWGYNARDRQWFANRHIFDVSPHRQRILAGDNTAPAAGDGEGRTMNLYLSNVWYELQRQLNSSARNAVTSGFGTIDWEYVDGVMKEHTNQVNNERDAYWRLNWMRSAIEQGDAGYTPYGGQHNYKAHNATNFQDHSTNFLRFINGDGSRDEGASWGDLPVAEENTYLTPAFQVWLESFARFSQSEWIQAIDPSLNTGRYSYGSTTQYLNLSPNAVRNTFAWKGGTGGHAARLIRMAQALGRDTDTRDGVMSYQAGGMHTSLINSMLAMGKALWPGPTNNPTPWDNYTISRANGPSAPTGLNATAQNAKIKLTWNGAPGAQSYNVKRRESSGEEWWTIKFFVQGTEFIDEDLEASKTYEYCISSNGTQYEEADSGAVLKSPSVGLIAHWNFDEASGEPAESESPSGMRNGVIIKSADRSIAGTVEQNVSGISGKGIRFGGYGHVSSPVALNFALGRSGSVSAWIKTESGQANVSSVLGSIGSDSENEMQWGYVDSGGNIAFDFSGTALTGPKVNDGSWHHIAMTRDQQSGQLRLYVDGDLASSGSDTTDYIERARVFRIGGSTIDELKVFNHVLSSAEVSDLATPPTGGGSGQFAEAENLAQNSSAGTATIADSSASGGYHVQSKAKTLGDWIEFTVNVPTAGTYDVMAGIRKRFNSGIWQLSVGGFNVGLPQDFYSPGQDWTEVQFGTATLTAGNNTLRFQTTGKNPGSSNFMGYFDSITLLPTTASEQFHEVENLPNSASVATASLTNTAASNGRYIQVKSNSSGEWIEMTVQVAQAGNYDLIMGIRKRFNSGIWQLSVDGVNVGPPIDLYTPGQDWNEYVFGSRNLSAGSHTFRLQTTGKNPSSSNHMGYFDTLILSPAGSRN